VKGRREIGRLGERLAAGALEKGGYRVLERNFRTREGELDLIAVRDGTLVFCEVKTVIARPGPGGPSGPLHPLEALGSGKRTQVRRLARIWLGERAAAGPAGGHRYARFDAIAVVLSPTGRLLRLDHLEGAF
jgi:putative endonuclease